VVAETGTKLKKVSIYLSLSAAFPFEYRHSIDSNLKERNDITVYKETAVAVA
jgi:hypothetical protein